jgi:hypothetical protein
MLLRLLVVGVLRAWPCASNSVWWVFATATTLEHQHAMHSSDGAPVQHCIVTGAHPAELLMKLCSLTCETCCCCCRVMQAWLFFSDSRFWQPPQIQVGIRLLCQPPLLLACLLRSALFCMLGALAASQWSACIPAPQSESVCCKPL